jgi:hypothetical protein
MEALIFRMAGDTLLVEAEAGAKLQIQVANATAFARSTGRTG